MVTSGSVAEREQCVEHAALVRRRQRQLGLAAHHGLDVRDLLQHFVEVIGAEVTNDETTRSIVAEREAGRVNQRYHY